MSDPTALTAAALSQAIHARDISCREVMQAYLARIARLNPRVNAIVSLQPEDMLLAQADERDRELARGEWRGWMHGFPLAIKDLAATAGIRTTLASPLLRDFVPAEDAIFVARMKAAGGIVIGKTNTPEFGLGSHTYNMVFGPTRNPFDPTRSCGGSSGGAAVAVALRMVPVADGSDMMGSLRNPAAWCNVLGFRPSYGRVPAGPTPEIFLQQLSTDGPMARTMTDLALLLSTQAGPDPRSPLSIAEDPAVFAAPLARDVKGLRIGWLGDLGGYLPFEDGILPLCESALAVLRDLGCHVDDAALGFAPERIWTAWRELRHWLVAGRLGALYADPAKRPHIKPEARWEIENGLVLSAGRILELSAIRSAWYQRAVTLFQQYDYLALPTAQVFPFDVGLHWPTHVAGRAMDTYHRWMEVVVAPGLIGLPTINVPVGFGANGLPMGLQLFGPQRADFAVLQLACAYEQATGWVARRPPPEA